MTESHSISASKISMVYVSGFLLTLAGAYVVSKKQEEKGIEEMLIKK